MDFRVLVLLGLGLVLSALPTSFAVEGYYARAVVESCKGCQLNRLPDVKAFIFEDLPNYENVEYKHIQGAPPELVLFDHHEEVVERIKLAQLTRTECNELFASKGFKRSRPVKDEI